MKKREEEEEKESGWMEEILEKGEPLRNANWSREIFMEERGMCLFSPSTQKVRQTDEHDKRLQEDFERNEG